MKGADCQDRGPREGHGEGQGPGGRLEAEGGRRWRRARGAGIFPGPSFAKEGGKRRRKGRRGVSSLGWKRSDGVGWVAVRPSEPQAPEKYQKVGEK